MGGDFFVVAMIFFVLRCAIETATGSFFRYGTVFYGSNGAGCGNKMAKVLKKITSKGNYSEKSCIFAFENKT
jgi:hypothetical protein